MDRVNILGVEIDKVSLGGSVEAVRDWVEGKSAKKHMIVTPNLEFIMAAQTDLEFKKILNQADLKIPDSSRVGWAVKVSKPRSRINKLLLIPFVLVPKLISDFPVTTGIDLMGKLCQISEKNGFRISLLGGRKGVAKKAADCLVKKYPDLKIAFAEAGPDVTTEGEQVSEFDFPKQQVDILFVAFGQVKQEKWIYRNLDKLPVKVAMGVGGAFDYLSGQVSRAPVWMRSLGLEWLYRLIREPWRIKRQIKLLKFVYLLISK